MKLKLCLLGVYMYSYSSERDANAKISLEAKWCSKGLGDCLLRRSAENLRVRWIWPVKDVRGYCMRVDAVFCSVCLLRKERTKAAGGSLENMQ